MRRFFGLVQERHRSAYMAVHVIRDALSALGVEHSVRPIEVAPFSYRIDVATAVPLYAAEKKILRGCIDLLCPPGTLLVICFGSVKGGRR